MPVLEREPTPKLGFRFEAAPGGYLVTHVDKGSPADSSGLAQGDLVVAAAAQPDTEMVSVRTIDTGFFLALLREADPVFLRLRRKEKEFAVCVQVTVGMTECGTHGAPATPSSPGVKVSPPPMVLSPRPGEGPYDRTWRDISALLGGPAQHRPSPHGNGNGSEVPHNPPWGQTGPGYYPKAASPGQVLQSAPTGTSNLAWGMKRQPREKNSDRSPRSPQVVLGERVRGGESGLRNDSNFVNVSAKTEGRSEGGAGRAGVAMSSAPAQGGLHRGPMGGLTAPSASPSTSQAPAVALRPRSKTPGPDTDGSGTLPSTPVSGAQRRARTPQARMLREEEKREARNERSRRPREAVLAGRSMLRPANRQFQDGSERPGNDPGLQSAPPGTDSWGLRGDSVGGAEKLPGVSHKLVEMQQARIEALERQLAAQVQAQSNSPSSSKPSAVTMPQTDGRSGVDVRANQQLQDAYEQIERLKATVSEMRQRQITTEKERERELRDREREMEKEREHAAVLKRDATAVKVSLMQAADLASELKAAEAKLAQAEKTATHYQRRHRRAQQQIEHLTDVLNDAKGEIEQLRKETSDFSEAGTSPAPGADLVREELDLKRNEMLEQEQRLVEVMREACVVRREAAAAKDGQEELLLQAVLEGSKEAFLCRQVLAKEKEMEQQLEYQNTLVNDLAVDHRRLNSLVVECKETALRVRPKGIIPVRVMGALDTAPGGVMRQAASEGRFGQTLEENQTAAAKLAKLLRDPTFHPFTTDKSDPAHPRERINHRDQRLETVRKAYGRAVADDVVRALSELNRWNASGRYPVEIPWHYEEERELTPAEMLETIAIHARCWPNVKRK